MSADTIPEGFVEMRGRGPFSTHNGPVYHKTVDGAYWHGFRVLDRHCNGQGIVHGGWLSSFADGLLGAAVWRASGSRAVTLRLTVDFVGMARAGDWVQGTAKIDRLTRTLAFAQAEAQSAGGRPVLVAGAVFKLMSLRPAKRLQ